MNHIYVRHLRNNELTCPSFLVDRSTSLGNPYYEYSRELNIQMYFNDFWNILKGDEKAEQYFLRIAAQFELTDIVLLCHCHPLECHADVIKDNLMCYYNHTQALKNVPN